MTPAITVVPTAKGEKREAFLVLLFRESECGGKGRRRAIDMFCCCSGMCALEKKVKVAHYGFGGKMEVGKSQKLQWKEKGNLSNHNCCTTLVSRILLSMISEENIIA